MRRFLQTTFWLIVISLCCQTAAQAQFSRSNNKSSNLYRSSYQRMSTGCTGTSTFEIRGGKLWAWGNNSSSKLGNGNTTNQTSPIQIGSDSTWVSISTGFYHTVGLKSNGTLWAWGGNGSGQLGDSTNTTRTTPIQIGVDSTWVSVSAGEFYTIGLKSNGTLWAWGVNSDGQLGDGTTNNKISPTKIGSDSTWVSISAGGYHTLALKSNGTLWAWGYNGSGGLGDGTTTPQTSPIKIGSDTTWVSIAAGGKGHSAALKSNGTLWTWGNNYSGQLGDGSSGPSAYRTSPYQIDNDSTWVSVTTGYDHTAALKCNGALWVWGANSQGEVGDGTTTDRNVPTKIVTDSSWVSVVAEGYHMIALKSDGTLWTWGDNASGQIGNGSSPTDITTPLQVRKSNRDWIQIACGHAHNLALKGDGTIWTWGQNDHGQIGDGTGGSGTNDKKVPIQVGSDNKWVSVATSGSNSFALKCDGTLWSWGYDFAGSLGDGGTPNTDTKNPGQIGTDKDWVSIYPVGGSCFALKSNGTLWAWGYNLYGQLGDGTSGSTANKTAPVQIGNDKKWVSVSTGGFITTLALKSDGTLWAWGFGGTGGLGNSDPTYANQANPIQIGTDNKWTTVATGYHYSAALKSDGTLWTWGINDTGQLGKGTTGGKTNVPGKIGTDRNWISIATGYTHIFAMKSNGTGWVWGPNTYGQHGDGTNGTSTFKNVPTQLSGQTNLVVSSRRIGGMHTAIMKSDRASICMTGHNDFGQLANGNTTDANTFSCSNNVCRTYPYLATGTSTSYTQPLGGVNNRTDFQSSCTLGASIIPTGTGAAGVTGSCTTTVLNESTVLTGPGGLYAYVTRHYDLRPAVNPTTTTGTVILYFTQGDFDSYNSYIGTHSGSGTALPTGPSDALGIGRLRVTQYNGAPSGTTYRPADYTSSTRTLIDPNSLGSVAWNADDSRWEVTLPVTGFGGFFVHGNNSNLPLQRLAPGSNSTFGEDSQITSVEADRAVRVYPSPANEYLIIEGGTGTISGVFTDLQGRVLMQVSTKSGDRINVSALSAGLYMLRLSDGNTFKVVVSH